MDVMSNRRRIPAKTQDRVRERAKGLCEYCHAVEEWQYVRFSIDHLTPVAHGGTNAFGNLALACFHCNRRKAADETATDPVTGKQTPFYNPRSDIWVDHFIWSFDTLTLIGLTPKGRATVAALETNRPWALNIRAADRAVGRHPPDDDPLQEVSE